MAVYLCHAEPDLYVHDADVLDARPGAVALSRSAFHPGGGGQVGDVGHLQWDGGTVDVTHVELDAPWGHDTFLIAREGVGGPIKRHLEHG